MNASKRLIIIVNGKNILPTSLPIPEASLKNLGAVFITELTVFLIGSIIFASLTPPLPPNKSLILLNDEPIDLNDFNIGANIPLSGLSILSIPFVKGAKAFFILTPTPLNKSFNDLPMSINLLPIEVKNPLIFIIIGPNSLSSFNNFLRGLKPSFNNFPRDLRLSARPLTKPTARPGMIERAADIPTPTLPDILSVSILISTFGSLSAIFSSTSFCSLASSAF